jgi:hypothetical protein
MLRATPACLIAIGLLALPQAVPAQALPQGHLSLFGDYFPNRQDTTELRARVFVEEAFDPSPRVLITASAFADGLLARRPGTGANLESVSGGIVRIHDLNVRFSNDRVDLLAGYARVVWGTLDEIQPTDVINPLDVSRFFFEGRSEARLPVLLFRGRVDLSEAVAFEGIYLPDFRRGRFDQLEEPSSPFNLPARVPPDVVCLAIGCPLLPLPVDDREPPFTATNAQGGARMSVTTGRVDWGVSAFRGFEPFGLYSIDTSSSPQLLLTYPRFTMIGGDFEAVRGEWGFRGELAAFVDDNFQSPDLSIIDGTSFDAGAGFDRKAGDYTISGTLLFHSESYAAPLSVRDRRRGRTDISLVASADRTFARERYRLRGFGLYSATEASGFIRGIGIVSLRDNVALEGSLGWFWGDGEDLAGRFRDSDFTYVRLKYYF